MAEKNTLPNDGTPAAYADWPTLIERAVDDLSGILRSEVHMLQASIGAALDLQIFNTVAHLTIVAVMISGALCILFSSILFLRQWLPWWQAFGIAGMATLVVGMVSNTAMRRSAKGKN